MAKLRKLAFMQDLRIRCPKCSWRPDGQPYWQCYCGHVWNTFETQGRCPACGFRHQDTQCVPEAGGCDEMSPHIDWYEGLDHVLDELLEEEKVPTWLRHGDVR
jgi:DNA-directed RNA polymerase subunit RPC12/RpoP